MPKKLSSTDMANSSMMFKSQNDQIIHIIEEFDLEIASFNVGVKFLFVDFQSEIKALEDSEKEYLNSLKLLSNKKEDLESSMTENNQWAANFDELIGPFEERFGFESKLLSYVDIRC